MRCKIDGWLENPNCMHLCDCHLDERNTTMSGPYCETCTHFVQPPLTDPDQGECGDRSKRVYDRNGNCMIEGPTVHKRFTCSNHDTR